MLLHPYPGLAGLGLNSYQLFGRGDFNKSKQEIRRAENKNQWPPHLAEAAPPECGSVLGGHSMSVQP